MGSNPEDPAGERRPMIERHYPSYRFGGFTDIDGTIAFYTRLRALVEPSYVILDVGCGQGTGLEDPVRIRREVRFFRGYCKYVIGIDVDPAGSENRAVDEFRLVLGPRWPVDSGTVDLAFADSVLEHVSEPESFFAECQRVIKPGGYLCIRTPNILSGFGLMARLIPEHRHRSILSIVQPNRRREEIFPAFYRANTRRKLSTLLRRYGFEGCIYGYEAEPSYVPPSWGVLYRLAVWHSRHVPSALRTCLFVFTRRLAERAS